VQKRWDIIKGLKMRPTKEQLASVEWWEENVPEGVNYCYEMSGDTQFADEHGKWDQAGECQLIIHPDTWRLLATRPTSTPESTPESSGGSCNYYKAEVYSLELDKTQEVECKDVMHALKLNHAEINIFKEIWRGAAARQGKAKAGSTPLRGAQKIKYFADENLGLVEKGK